MIPLHVLSSAGNNVEGQDKRRFDRTSYGDVNARVQIVRSCISLLNILPPVLQLILIVSLSLHLNAYSLQVELFLLHCSMTLWYQLPETEDRRRVIWSISILVFDALRWYIYRVPRVLYCQSGFIIRLRHEVLGSCQRLSLVSCTDCLRCQLVCWIEQLLCLQSSGR